MIVAGLPAYVFPPQDDPAGADVVFVIGPPDPRRVDLAEQLLGAGATAALVSVPGPDQGPPELTQTGLAFCSEPAVTCRTPVPFTTAGEALMLADSALPDGAEVVVVTFTPHVARTRYLFEKCYPGTVSVVGVDPSLSLGDWIYQYAYQSAAFVKAWLTPCDGAETLPGITP